MNPVIRTIAAESATVWRLISDVEHWAQLLPTVNSVTALDPGPPAVGSRYQLRQPGLPTSVYRIVEWDPGEGFTWVAQSLGVRTEASHRVVRVDAGSRLELTMAWRGPLSGLVDRLLRTKATGYVEQEAASFAALAEADAVRDSE